MSKIIYESWADAVEWYLTTHEYSILGSPYVHNWKQDWTINNLKDYTPLFIDLVDNRNQRLDHFNSTLYPNDNITGYTMQKLNEILVNIYGLSSLKSALKNNKPIGVTDSQIDEFLLTFENLK